MDCNVMNASVQINVARASIVGTATRLFYENGYKATGINEVISESKVAKATFYAHFISKEALYLEVLRLRHDEEMAQMLAFIDKRKTPQTRFLAPIEFIGPWLEKNNLRGCAFLNMTSEIPEKASLIRKEGRKHYEALRLLLTDLAAEFIAATPTRFEHSESKRMGDEYLTLMTGAIALTQIYSETWPIRHAVKQVRSMMADRT